MGNVQLLDTPVGSMRFAVACGSLGGCASGDDSEIVVDVADELAVSFADNQVGLIQLGPIHADTANTLVSDGKSRLPIRGVVCGPGVREITVETVKRVLASYGYEEAACRVTRSKSPYMLSR
jgi:hypothetical protein